MNIKLMNVTSYALFIVGFTTAFYVAYMQWFEDIFIPSLLFISIAFSLLAGAIKKYIKKRKD